MAGTDLEQQRSGRQQQAADLHVPPVKASAKRSDNGRYESVSEEEEGPGSRPPAAPGSPAFDPAFAPPSHPFAFWQDAALLLLLGGALGALAYGYLKAISEVTGAWMAADGRAGYPSPGTLGFGSGRAWWVGLCGGAGLAVGLAKAALRLDTAPSFIDELRSLHSDPPTALKVTFVALLGLMGGVPMGPEAGLGAAAGAAGWVLATRVRPRFRVQASPRRKVYVLSAMCSCFSGLMPSAMCALLLVLELGKPAPLARAFTFMGLVCILAAGATAAFVVYYAIAGYPYLQPLVTAVSIQSFTSYGQLGIVEGMLFGVMGAALSFAYILMAGMAKAVVGPIRQSLDARLGRWPRAVVLATAGGAVVGAVGWAMPLTLTDGASQLGSILGQGAELGSSVLAASCFAKMALYHLCAECGFHGGLFLPMLAMSSMLGSVFINITGVNPTVARSCSLVALGAALVPAPFALAVLATSVLMVGAQGLVPLFATACTSHLLCLGLGWPQAMVAAGERRNKAAADEQAAAAGAAAAAAAEVAVAEAEQQGAAAVHGLPAP